MFDPKFNPYDALEQLQNHLTHCSNSVIKLAKAFESTSQLQEQIVTQLNQQTLTLNNQEQVIHQLHDRIRLLEIARQYENKNTN
jgi:hypothetical protein